MNIIFSPKYNDPKKYLDIKVAFKTTVDKKNQVIIIVAEVKCISQSANSSFH